MAEDERGKAGDRGLGLPPSTAPPASVRAAILARVVQQTVGGVETPLLDGRYRLLSEIGRGGAGTVWKAELLPLGRLVAVKQLRPGVDSTGTAVSRLMREAMTVSKLGHDHIVQVNDVGTDENGSPYIAMELLEGESLSQLVATHGRLPWSDVSAIALQLCDALCAAHAVGIVHRDVKPANVITIRREDRDWHCKLLDFGLCTDGREPSVLTAAGILLGTPGYAAVEQIRGDVVDGRADLYGLACVMVELLTGRPAFQAETRQGVVTCQIAGRRSGELDALDLPPGVVALIDRGLSLDPQDRHSDLNAFADAIAGARSSPSSGAERVHHPPRPRGRRLLLGVASVVLCAITLAAASSSSDTPAEESPPTPARVVVPQAPPEALPDRDVPDPRPPSVPPTQDASKSPAPVAPTTSPPARARRPRKPRPKPATAEPQLRRAYADGIRDPFNRPATQ